MRKSFEHALILGVGGGAGKIVHQVAQLTSGEWLRLVAMDTDVKDLSFNDGVHHIPMGENWCKGRSCGGDSTRAENVTADMVDDIRGLTDDVDVVIVVGCLGGGTASGALPLINRILKEEDVRSFCFATVPAEFEGSERKECAAAAMEEMLAHDDLVLRYENDLLFSAFDDDIRFLEAMNRINSFLADGILGLASVVRSREGIPLDLETLNTSLSEKPAACSFASAYVEGDGACREVVKQLSQSPTLGGDDFLRSADLVIAAISGGNSLSLGELRICIHDLQSTVGSASRTLCAATVLDDQAESSVRLTMVAIKFKRVKDRISSESFERLKRGENTIQMDGGENLPVSIHDVSGMLGAFGNATPTIVNGENLDMPTFMRNGIGIQDIIEEVCADEDDVE
jgi:cell division protein FtsZ